MNWSGSPPACGRRFSTFNVENDFNREDPHVGVSTSISSRRPARIFERLQQERGLTQVLYTDNDLEFVGEDFTECSIGRRTAIQYIQPGKPVQLSIEV